MANLDKLVRQAEHELDLAIEQGDEIKVQEILVVLGNLEFLQNKLFVK